MVLILKIYSLFGFTAIFLFKFFFSFLSANSAVYIQALFIFLENSVLVIGNNILYFLFTGFSLFARPFVCLYAEKRLKFVFF